MQVFCPQCGTGSDVAAGAQAATCASCGASLPVNMPMYGPPDLGSRPRAFGVEEMAMAQPMAAPTVTVTWNERQMPDGSWMVVTRGRGPALFAVFFVVFGAIAVLLFADTPSPVMPLFPGLLAAWFAYRALCAATNTITIRFDRQSVTCTSSPFWQPGTFRVLLGDVLGIGRVKTGTTSVGGVRTSSWAPQLTTMRGYTVRIPVGVSQREQVDVVIRRLSQMLADMQRQAGIQPPQQNPM